MNSKEFNNENTHKAYRLFTKGKRLSKNKKFLKAIMLLEEAKKIEPEKGSIREELAMAYYNCGLHSSAKNNFIKALDIDITNDYAHYGLGLCLIKEGSLDKGLGHIKIASAMNPRHKIYRNAVEKYSSIIRLLDY